MQTERETIGLWSSVESSTPDTTLGIEAGDRRDSLARTSTPAAAPGNIRR